MRLNKVAGMFMGFILLASSQLWAADYKIDTQGAHAFIQFRVKHLGYSWLYGRFNTFEGSFSYDEKKPEATKVNVTIDTASVDSNHAERDKHLRSDDFLDVKKYPKATFVSKKVIPKGDDKAVLVGDLTLHGVTKEVTIDVTAIGGGKDPWGGYRQGFQGSTSFKLKDFNIKKDLGPASQEVELILSIEGIRQG
ncbi:YceI family protein [Spartinivicinus poritis]|uniref:YceI family protein n=1 Tax=Spartinivicinus poritis TaxID=2994640 RepID=A0ABT5UDB6_9GAMM|nr:YceI family protein [Spartinivicinus sp. A2-2]MDE1464360.1 YceI family protein [Spartinivicinus sp. A2-2]